MGVIAIQPSISELNGFIARVNKFPISAGDLLKFAREDKAPTEVIGFYRRFAPDRIFESKDDLAGSSEQVELMRAEEKQMPQEEERGPEEY